jgi:oligogalacturonide transporter
MKTRKIGLANYLAYGSGDFLGAGTTALTAAWLLYFYTTFCGLSRLKQRSSLPQGCWMPLSAR